VFQRLQPQRESLAIFRRRLETTFADSTGDEQIANQACGAGGASMVASESVK